MSVVQMTPCILTADWAGFVAWCATTFDLPVACQFEQQGWGRLTVPSRGMTVIQRTHFTESIGNDGVVIELEVVDLPLHFQRAIQAGATEVVAPTEVADGMLHAALISPQGVRLWLLSNTPTPAAGVHDGPVHFCADKRIEADVETVFRAATERRSLERFFVERADRDLDALGQVTWTWGDGSSSDLEVTTFRPNAHIAFHWPGNAVGYRIRTQMTFTETQDGHTRVAITDAGWDADPAGLKSAFAHCEGWTSFLLQLKQAVEAG